MFIKRGKYILFLFKEVFIVYLECIVSLSFTFKGLLGLFKGLLYMPDHVKKLCQTNQKFSTKQSETSVPVPFTRSII